MDSHGNATFDSAQAQRLVEQFAVERDEQTVLRVGQDALASGRHGALVHVTLIEMNQREWDKWRMQ